MTTTLVMAREPLPAPGTRPSVFLAGPTPRLGGPVESWRPAAIAELDAQWDEHHGELAVFSPESRGGRRAAHYDDQVEWETQAREQASVVLFWIPRDVEHMPGFTTNIEFGLDIASGRRVVLGCPEDCPNPERNRYLRWVAHRHGAPVRETLVDTVYAALGLITAPAGPRPNTGQGEITVGGITVRGAVNVGLVAENIANLTIRKP